MQKNNLVMYPQRRSNFSGICNLKLYTSSVYSELFQGIADGLAGVAFLRNITFLSINMKATMQQVSMRAASKLYQAIAGLVWSISRNSLRPKCLNQLLSPLQIRKFLKLKSFEMFCIVKPKDSFVRVLFYVTMSLISCI